MTATTTGIPDLLQRFVQTPFSGTIAVDGAEITLHSNAEFAAISKRALPPGDVPVDRLFATIVQDFEAPNPDSGITIIKSWPVTTVLCGTGTVLALDCERSEILGFLAPSVPTTRFVDELLPILINLYRELKSGERLQKQRTEHE
jgi:hypothetical protein